jgi:DNA invertase Pin-like site-specific DNA recombinase
MEGIIIPKKKGLYKGRAKSLNNEQIEIIREKVLAGIPKAKVAREFNISRRSLYSYLATYLDIN